MKLKHLLLPALALIAAAPPSHAIAVLLKKGQAGTGATSTAVALLLVDSATGQTGQPGLSASVTKIVELPGATSYIAATGTLVDTGGGVYDYFPAASETAATGVLKLRITGTGVQTYDTSAQIVGFDPTDGTLLGLTGVGTLANQTTIITGINGVPAAVWIYTASDGLTHQQSDALRTAILARGFAVTYTASTRTQVTTYFKADGVTVLATTTVVYDLTARAMSRTTVFTNLP